MAVSSGTGASAKFVSALTTYEDKRFWLHPGIDPLAGMRALYSNIHCRKIVSGASTIPMQVVRLSRNGKARTIPEKCIEVALAIRLSLTARKTTVLSLYASHAPFGGNVVGLEALRGVFRKKPGQASWLRLPRLPCCPTILRLSIRAVTAWFFSISAMSCSQNCMPMAKWILWDLWRPWPNRLSGSPETTGLCAAPARPRVCGIAPVKGP